MALLKLTSIVILASLCSGAVDWTLLNTSLKCHTFSKQSPNVILNMPSYATWCGRRISSADGAVVIGDGQCQTSVDWVESCCMQMFREQINFPVGGKPDLTKGRYGSPSGYRVGDEICRVLSKPGTEAKHELVLLFEYKCCPHFPGGPNDKGLVEMPHWLNDYENITASYDLLRKDNLQVSICCKDGLYQENC